MNKYVKIKPKGRSAFWAIEKESKEGMRIFLQVTKEGVFEQHHFHIYAENDIAWIRPAKMNNHYGWLEVDEGMDLLVKKIEAGKYEITRQDDGEKYIVIKSNKLFGTIEWIIERQSDYKVYSAASFGAAKLSIGKWRYI